MLKIQLSHLINQAKVQVFRHNDSRTRRKTRDQNFVALKDPWTKVKDYQETKITVKGHER